MKKRILLAAALSLQFSLFSQTVHIQIDAAANRWATSPYIFGRNNNLSDDPSSPVSTAEWRFYQDVGLKMVRESGGNNCTKYNWKQKLSSHPDWYNNVYAHDWDYAAQSLQTYLPGVQGMWAFQLLGKVASNTDHNFNDYAYNKSQWWSGTAQNLAGGGVPNDTAGKTKALVEGDTSLYLTYWPADSSVAILDQWFGNLGLDSSQFIYWNMDNEPEAWNGTHDDVVKTDMDVETYIQDYVAIATKARQKFPHIKLVGPVFTNEWQWYNWNNAKVVDKTTKKAYSWVEYFIKRISEEQTKAGLRLLDVLDFHFYPNSDARTTRQLHRIWFDSTYVYPGANGVKVTGTTSWNESITREYIFKRSAKWLDKYMGTGHGVNFAVSECGSVFNKNPNVVAVWYASQLGTFSSHNVEVFTPWDWYPGMWETLHLFSRYGLPFSVKSISDQDSLVSAYASTNANSDSMTVILVNRDSLQSRPTQLSLQNFAIPDGDYSLLTLSNLPQKETFVSHTQNALVKGQASVGSGQATLTLPPLSVTALQMSLVKPTGLEDVFLSDNFLFEVLPNPVEDFATVNLRIPTSAEVNLQLVDMLGRNVSTLHAGSWGSTGKTFQLDLSTLSNGIYHCILQTDTKQIAKKVVVRHSSH